MSETPSGEPEVTPPKSKGLGKGMGKKAIIAMALVVALLVAVPLGYMVLNKSDEGDDNTPEEETFTVQVVGASGSTAELNLTDLANMTYAEGVSSYQNSFMFWKGLGTYRGVNLSDIADLVGGMAPGDVMTVEATDGYAQNLSYYQVCPDEEYLAVQGNIVLAYSFNGTAATEWEDGPMVAVLAPDQAFSNDDFNATRARDPEFAKSTSAGSIWVRNICNITITHVFDEWTVTLGDIDGATTELTRTELVCLEYSEGTYFVDASLRNWSGVPLTAVLGLLDDDDPTTFNETVADTNYEIVVTAADGYAKTLNISYLLSDTVILADRLNGTPLDDDYTPLKMVGASLYKSEMVSQIASIVIWVPVLTLQCEDTVLEFTLAEVEELTAVTSSGAYKKTTGTIVGPNEYTGVALKDLVALVSDYADYSVEVVATDGYVMTYSYAQVNDGAFDYYETDGTLIGTGSFTMIVAYEMDGAPLEDMYLKIAIVDESAPITDGHFWAKYVKTITVLPAVQEYELTLEGLTTYTMDRPTFESAATCSYHALEYTFENETGTHTYSGIALWVLVSAVDGADGPDTEYLFNDLLAQAGYTVTVEASDGYSKTFSSIQVARNDTLIVANRLDGEALPAEEFPLRLVGAGLSSGQMVGMISTITLSGLQEMPDWSVWLNGTRDVQFSAETFAATYYSGLHGPYFNYTDYGGWHAAYYNYTDEFEVDHTYAGIPLWVLLSCVDGEDLYHYEFNETLAEAGYDVVLTASDGYSVTLSSADIMYNSSLVVAFMLDWEPLSVDEAPLRLVSEYLSGSQKVSMIVSIEMVL